MGLRGPQPISSAERAIRGTRPRTINRAEPQPPALSESAVCPARLKGAARDFWKRLAPLCQLTGTLTVVDVDMFEAGCVTYGELRALERTSARLGVELAIAKGVRKDLHATRADFMRFSQRFGLDPASRTGIKVKPPVGDSNVLTSRERFFGSRRA